MVSPDNSARMRGLFPWCGLALVATAVAGLLPHGVQLSPTAASAYLGVGTAACVVGCLSESSWRGLLTALGIAAWCVGAVIVGEIGLRGAVEAQARFSAISPLLSFLLGAFSPTTVSPEGDLVLLSHDGTLRFGMSVSTLGLVPIAGFYLGGLALLWSTAAPARQLGLFTILLAVAALLRAAFAIARFAQIDHVLTVSYPSHAETLQRPVEILLAMGCVGMCMALHRRGVQTRPATAGLGRRGWIGWAAATSALLFSSMAAAPPPTTVRKQGRVLIDDYLSDYWAPAARRLDWNWYGDFSTYSLSALVELTGYAYSVDVNTGRPYTADLLEAYDVLVLKVPARDVPETERAAILEWVDRGGGLWLIGDHTDLLGSSTRLNRFSLPAGIEFRSDSVMESATSGFTTYTGSSLWSHRDMRSVESLGFMTSCSLALRKKAEALIAAPRQSRQDHDWGQSSHFGSLYSDPRMDHGLIVLAATAPFGRGRIAAFGDSTILSSFAAFEPGREAMWFATLRHLNEAVIPYWHLRFVCAALASAALLLAFRNSRGVERETLCALFGAALITAGASWIGCFRLLERASDPVDWKERPSRLAIWRGNTEAIYPPVLGTPEGVDYGSSYDTLMAAVCRGGVFPRPVQSLEEALSEPAVLILNPLRPLDSDEQTALQRYVEEGGHLIIANKYDHFHLDALHSLLEPFAIHIDVHHGGSGNHFRLTGMEMQPVSTPEMSHAAASFGHGSIQVILGAERWSREELGHCFDLPGESRRAAYAVFGQVLERVAAIAPKDRRTYGILE